MANFCEKCLKLFALLSLSVLFSALFTQTIFAQTSNSNSQIRRNEEKQQFNNKWLFNSILAKKLNATMNENERPSMFAAILKLPIRTGFVRFSEKKPSTFPLSSKRRDKRRYHRQEWVQDVCPSISDWVPRTEAYDPYGNKLTVVQRIPINGTVINQYFYETFCANNYIEYFDDYEDGDFFGRKYHKKTEDIQCKGVDKTEWFSRCRENLIWTYGKVITNQGETGWSVIAIRGSCGCAIWPKRNLETFVGRGRRVTAEKNSVENFVLDDPFFKR